MHDLLVAVLAAFTGGVVVHVAHRVWADPIPPRPIPPVTPPNGALYGAPSVAPPAPGGLTWRQINAARVEREARRG